MALVIAGNVEIATPHGVAHLRGGPEGAVLELPDGPAGEQALRGLLDAIGGRDGIRRSDDALRRLGLGVQLVQSGRTLAQLGEGAAGSALGRVAGLGEAELHLGALIQLMTGR
jgi:hypothetical protein